MKNTIGKKFRNDPRILKAKQLLQEALSEYQVQISGVKEPEQELTKSYAELIDRCSQLRGGGLYYPYLASGIGRGALVELGDGSVKYDFITGIGVYYLGHNHSDLLTAGIDAALDDTVISGNLQQGVITVDVLESLVKAACCRGAKLEHCFLTSSGAMANENALKMIFQKHSPAHRFLAFNRCFAGRSMVMAQITDKASNREGLPKVLEVDYVPFYDPQAPQESTAKAVVCLQDHLTRHPGEYAGMMFELIQGEGGYYPGARSFFVALMEILKQHKVAVLVDEIQTFGRTSELFAFQYFHLDEYVDVVTTGKMLQVCATFFTENYKPNPGLISQTFTASSSALFAAKVILDQLINGGYLGEHGKIMKLSKYFVGRLEELEKHHPEWIKGPFGFGAMIGFSVLDGSAEKAKDFLSKLFKNGVLAFVAGSSPVRIRFLMPIGAVSAHDIDKVTQIIEQTLKEMAG